MVAVFVMNCEELPLHSREFPGAPGTDKAMNGQGTLPIILAWRLLIRLLEFSDDIFDRPRRNACRPLDCCPDTPPLISKGHLCHRCRGPYCLSLRGLEV